MPTQMPFNNIFENIIHSVKRTIAPKKFFIQELNVIANEIRNNAPTTRIKENVMISAITEYSGGGMSADIKISAPEARAYEFGSGLHGEDGQTYRIPKEGFGLAFEWDKVDETTPIGPKFRGILDDGRGLFRFVDHPGVEARPYARPSVEENLSQLRKSIGEALVQSIKEGVAVSIRSG